MLKFEDKFKVGDKIKALDFMPRPDVADSYIVGVVLEEKNTEQGFNAYKIEITDTVWAGKSDAEDNGEFAWIPHEMSAFDFDNRITLA